MSHGRWLVPLALGVAVLAAVTSGSASGRIASVPTQDETDVSETPGALSDGARVVVTNDGTVHVVWEEGLQIMHRKRDPRAGWLPSRVVFYGGKEPALATDGSRVALAVVRDPSRLNPDDRSAIHLRFWDEDADAWSELGPPVDLSEDGAQPDLAFSPADGALFVAWADHTYDTGRPYLARIVGESVQSAGKCGNFEVARAPSLAIDSEGTVYVARMDLLEEGEEPQVVYARRPHGGATCIGDEGPPAHDARVPSLAIDGDDFCLVWEQLLESGNSDVIMGCRVAGGWLAPNMSNSAAASGLPRLALDQEMGSLVVWQEEDSQRGAILFRQNPPPPAAAQLVNSPLVDAGMPDLFYADGFVHAVWTEWRSPTDSDIHYARWVVEAPTPSPTASDTPTKTPTPTGTSTRATETPTGTPEGRPAILLPYAEARR